MIDILLTADSNYAPYCKVVMKSILDNTKEDVHFHVIGSSFSLPNAHITFYKEPDTSIFKYTFQNGHINMSACYRLFAPYIKSLNKVVYIDIDTIVLGDIKELWDVDVEYIGGVLDPMWEHNANKNNLKDYYINSGVLVMNLDNLRKLPYMKMIMDTQTGKYNLSLLDQDIINIAFHDKIQLLPYEWNVYSKEYTGCTEDMKEARKSPKLIHWCGRGKPWNTKGLWKNEEWYKYFCEET